MHDKQRMDVNRTSGRPESSSNLLTAEQVAVMIGVSASCLRDWRMKGRGPHFVRLGYRCVRYRLEDIERWRRKLKVA